MVNGNKRLACGESKALAEVDSDQQRTDKSGCVSDSNGVDVLNAADGFKRFAHKRRNRFDMSA